ncbi:MAG TPA: hypothetical protein VG052_08755 [Puia sp.]|jgi:hypothetical protein|nr:hypothetical protein [Puia sp.]
MKKDLRYDIISPMYEAGKIESLLDIFKYIPKSVVAGDLGKKVDRFNRLMNNVEDFRIAELIMIGTLCDLDLSQMFKLLETEYLQQQRIQREEKKST